MSQMTWEELKKRVDKALEVKGLGGATPIWYIDVSFPETGDGYKSVEISVDSDNGLRVHT